jgi:hypothetical protein
MGSEDLESRINSIVDQILKDFMCDEEHNDILDIVFEDIIQKRMGINKTIAKSAGESLVKSFKRMKNSLCEAIKHDILENTPFKNNLINAAVKILREKNSAEEALKVVKEEIAKYLLEKPVAPKVNVNESYLDYLAERYKSDLIDTGLATYPDLINRLAPYSGNPIVAKFIIKLSQLESKREAKPSRPTARQPAKKAPTAILTPAISQRRRCSVINNYLILSDRDFPGYSPRTIRAIMKNMLPGAIPELFQGYYVLDLLPPDKLQLLRQIPDVKELPNPDREQLHPGYPSACTLDIFGAYRLDLKGFAIYTRVLVLGCLKTFTNTQVKEGRMNNSYVNFFDSQNRDVYKIDHKLGLSHMALVYTIGDNVKKFGNAVADLMTVLAKYRYNIEAFDYLSAIAWGLVYDFYIINKCLGSAT